MSVNVCRFVMERRAAHRAPVPENVHPYRRDRGAVVRVGRVVEAEVVALAGDGREHLRDGARACSRRVPVRSVEVDRPVALARRPVAIDAVDGTALDRPVRECSRGSVEGVEVVRTAGGDSKLPFNTRLVTVSADARDGVIVAPATARETKATSSRPRNSTGSRRPRLRITRFPIPSSNPDPHQLTRRLYGTRGLVRKDARSATEL